MWIRFDRQEVLGILHYTGTLVLGLAIAMCIPLVTALVFAEWDPALDYLVGVTFAAAVGYAMRFPVIEPIVLSHRQAVVISALAWFVAALLGAVPLLLSGHYGSYLDALFETMSGFTTSGLTLTQDMDHLAHAHNMWRHLTHLIGGQGIIVAAVSLAIGLRGGAFSLYLSEGRDERILPNVVNTARFIWFVTAIWVGFGTLATSLAGLAAGMPIPRALLHGFWMTVAAYDTGGFAPQSQNVLYYHSGWIELATILLMLAGTMNFNLHADIWRGDRTEVFRNLEARTIAVNITGLVLFASASAAASRLYAEPMEVVRKAAYHVISANSGTGHQSVYPTHWPNLGTATFYAVLLAMAFGGMVSSTAGGIKALRIGLMVKGVLIEVRRALSPPSAVVGTMYHHIKDRLVTPELIGAALMVFALYIATYLTGGLIGAAYGYPLGDALFESISAAANVGLSTGITTPAMPTGLKILYLLQMWAGRLEFFTILALLAAIFTSVLPKRGQR